MLGRTHNNFREEVINMLSPNEENWRNLGDPSACKVCKGKRCCQHNACTASPEDFNNSLSLMRNAIQNGGYSVDLFRTESSFIFRSNFFTLNFDEILRNPDECFYIRARNIRQGPIDIIHETEGPYGPCIMWNPQLGCKLSYENRPKFGRTLVPNPNGGCFDYYDVFSKDGLRAQIIKEWKPFHKFMVDLVHEFSDPNKPLRIPGLPPFRIL